jgi:hypothetical protein
MGIDTACEEAPLERDIVSAFALEETAVAAETDARLMLPFPSFEPPNHLLLFGLVVGETEDVLAASSSAVPLGIFNFGLTESEVAPSRGLSIAGGISTSSASLNHFLRRV